MAEIQVIKYFEKQAKAEERRKLKIQKKQGNQGKRTLKKQPSKAKSDSENDWEIEEDSEATSDQGSEAAEEAASNSQASCSEAGGGSDSEA